MNRRLQSGALLGRITATILASLLLMPLLPVAASDSVPIQSSDTTVKTLPPLPEGNVSDPRAGQPAAEIAAKPSLTFTPADPETTTTGSGDIVRPGDQILLAPPQPAAGTALTPQADPATADSAPPSAVAEAPPVTPSTANTDTSDSVPAEVTTPQPVPKDGAEVAQANPSVPRTPLDPAFKKLPSTVGSVRLKKAFDRFSSNAIIHNMSFRDTPVKEVVSEVGRRGNINIIIDKSVIGRITGDLHDVTLNEAMETVLSSAGLQWRQLDNSTVIIGTPNALTNLGLNRPLARAYKLSYVHPFDAANLLYASVFNRGILPDFSQAIRNRSVSLSRETPSTKSAEEVIRATTSAAPGGGTQSSKTSNVSTVNTDQNEENEQGEEINQTTRPDTARTVRGTSRQQINEGTGFNSGSVDPGSQTIRSQVTVVSDYTVEQNGGGAIVIPDAKNNQVFIVGTEQDQQIAEEAIRLIDRRPKQVHIQSSLVELTNQGIRQLGAALNLQGEGASGTVLGGAGAPMINFLPGLGSVGQFLTQYVTNGAQSLFNVNRVSGIPPTPVQFSGFNGATNIIASSLGDQGTTPTDPTTSPNAVISGISTLTPVPVPTNGFGGVLGTALPITTPTIAGVQAVPQAQTGFNFLTLGRRAGGRSNIATLPTGLNLTLNLVLQTNKAKILANPSVVVSDNTEALITLANEVVHKVTTTVSLGVVSTNVELVKAGIFLNVLPRIAEDGFVMLRLRPQVSSPLGGPQVFAGGSVVVTLLNVRDIMTQEVRVKDGQTLVIGGLFTEQEASTLAKVPYLAEAPILGAIFRNSIKGRNRTELMLLITPKIVEDSPLGSPIADTTTPAPTM